MALSIFICLSLSSAFASERGFSILQPDRAVEFANNASSTKNEKTGNQPAETKGQSEGNNVRNEYHTDEKMM